MRLIFLSVLPLLSCFVCSKAASSSCPEASFDSFKNEKQVGWAHRRHTLSDKVITLIDELLLAGNFDDCYVLNRYNLLRELLHLKHISNVSNVDRKWLLGVREAAQVYKKLGPRLEALTIRQEALVQEAAKAVGVRPVVAVATQGGGGATMAGETPCILLPSLPDYDLQLFTAYHELGHIVHQDTHLDQDAELYRKLINEPPFIKDIQKFSDFVNKGKAVFDQKSKTGQLIQNKLDEDPSLALQYPEKNSFLAFTKGKEKRADLFAIENLFKQNLIKPLLKALHEFAAKEEFEDVESFAQSSHPPYVQRALALWGFLASKNFPINQAIKDWEEHGQCLSTEDIISFSSMPLKANDSSFNQGVTDFEKANALGAHRVKRFSLDDF